MLRTLDISVRYLGAELVGRGGLATSDRLWHCWSRDILGYGDVSVTVGGLSVFAQPPPFVLMSNHSSLLDIPVLIAVVPHTLRMVIQAELMRIPIWGRAMLRSGFIPISRGDRKHRKQEDAPAYPIFGIHGLGLHSGHAMLVRHTFTSATGRLNVAYQRPRPARRRPPSDPSPAPTLRRGLSHRPCTSVAARSSTSLTPPAPAIAGRKCPADEGGWPTWDIDTRFRRVVLKRFPYLLFFELRADSIEFVAVGHVRREPGYRVDRIRTATSQEDEKGP